jgi:hypothetical protein
MTKGLVVPTFLISLTQSILIILNKSWSMLLRRDSLLKVFKTRIKLSRQLMTGMMNYRKCRFCPVSQFLKHFLIFFQLQKNLAKPCIFLKQVPRRSILIRRESLFLFLAQSENIISKSILRARNRIHQLQRKTTKETSSCPLRIHTTQRNLCKSDMFDMVNAYSLIY